MNSPTAKIPNTVQPGIDPDVYRKLSAHPQCSRLGKPCATPCQPQNEDGTYDVEIDHIIPRSRGGSNEIDNLQWLCKCENRAKYNKPDVNYSGNLYFDNEITVSALRPHQLVSGYRKVVEEYRHIFESPAQLYDRFMLLPWMVGAGKTVGMLSILFGINHARKNLGNGSARRVKRTLWLVHQRALVRSLAREIRDELVFHGIIDRSPKVVEVTDSAKWNYQGDIVVACPQALWEVKNRTLSDEDRASILSQFDAIVVDEGHFGIDRYLSLAKLAPVAFKFAITATPMNANGEMLCEMDGGAYRSWFVLFSLFGFGEGRELGIYKDLPSMSEGFNKVYFQEDGGDAVIMSGNENRREHNTRVSNNLPRAIALINSARNKAIAADISSGYDNHVMVRCDNIGEAEALVKAFEDEGDVCGVWSGKSGPSLGDDKHEWMLAKSNKPKGRIPKNGKRIVVCVDIGQFGINNPYCSIIVWVSANFSLVELVQRIGRAIRGQGKVRLIWNGADSRFKDRLGEAIDYVLDMESRMAGFILMGELSGNPSSIQVTPAMSAVKPSDRVALGNMIGTLMSSGEDIGTAIKTAASEYAAHIGASEDYSSSLQRYAELLGTPEGRDKVLGIPGIFEPSSLCLNESPVAEYSTERLLSALRSGEVAPRLSDTLRGLKAQRIVDGDALSIEEVKQELTSLDEKARTLDDIAFYPPYNIVMGAGKTSIKLPCQPYIGVLLAKYGPLFADRSTLHKNLSQILASEVAAHYGMRNFQRDTYQKYEKQLSAALMRESERRNILAKAEYALLQRDLPELHGLTVLHNLGPMEYSDVA